MSCARTGGRHRCDTPAVSLTVHSTDTYDVRAGTDAALAIAAPRPSERPTAVFAINDLIASGLVRGLRPAGLPDPGGRRHHRLRRPARGADRVRAADHDPQPAPRHRPWATSLLLEEIAAADSPRQPHPSQLRLQPELVVETPPPGSLDGRSRHNRR